MTSRAEAFVIFRTGLARQEALDAARGVGASRQCKIELEARPGRVHILAECDGSDMDALASASMAALALIGAMKDDSAMIESVKRCAAARPAFRSVSQRGTRPRPQLLMGEVSAPRVMPDNAREAFRNFMTAKRLRPTSWARDAGVSSGEILGFLTGRSRGFSPDVAAKLAQVAGVTPEDMFR